MEIYKLLPFYDGNLQVIANVHVYSRMSHIPLGTPHSLVDLKLLG